MPKLPFFFFFYFLFLIAVVRDVPGVEKKVANS